MELARKRVALRKQKEIEEQQAKTRKRVLGVMGAVAATALTLGVTYAGGYKSGYQKGKEDAKNDTTEQISPKAVSHEETLSLNSNPEASDTKTVDENIDKKTVDQHVQTILFTQAINSLNDY